MTALTKDGRVSAYAELLSNIRQVSIAASLPSPPNARTTAKILDDGRKLCIEHDGMMEHMDLPGKVSHTGPLAVSQSASSELAWRLPLSTTATQVHQFSPETQSIPWSASDLERGSAVCCRSCSSILIQKDVIQSWKDLPSENWAEMMEFWHCHKPHDHSEHQNESLANKGYGANSAITAQPGIGFVDITSFMFDEANCQNLLVSRSSANAFILFCYCPMLRSHGEIEGGQIRRSRLLCDMVTDTLPQYHFCFCQFLSGMTYANETSSFEDGFTWPGLNGEPHSTVN